MVEDDRIMRKIISAGGAHAKRGVDARVLRAARESGLARWFALRSSKPLPVPKARPDDERLLVRLVDEAREMKAADPDADTWWLEVQIDDLVYDLYGLSEEETTAIERSLGRIHQTDEEEDAAIAKWIEAGRTGKYVSESVIMETLRNPHGN